MCSKGYCSFEQKLAYHSAPSLLGIKCANLISLGRHEYDIEGYMQRFNSTVSVKGLRMRLMCECSERALLMVYNEKKLACRLSSPECREILRDCGYTDDMSSEQCLRRLGERMAQGDGFPHEIGLFLDYPVEDVVGFIENNGNNFKLCGYWKVYGDADKARRTFENYNKCRRFLCGKLNEGEDIRRALKIS